MNETTVTYNYTS